ncbi:hypothetical protein SEMRO_548_G164310.1 [Seminavis robusta]|uniref:Uncharacterized protein n=1 Tax=Seminavis robusta TaxID=568900 RepID=A0A9N8HFZ0_9STRA|nr:hypothetical protein SEMRO_548_G164310.1 [Seminavis robusta]|eukprot:Sro548_g164310.1 n/a (639) ;mRNA; r:573-2489
MPLFSARIVNEALRNRGRAHGDQRVSKAFPTDPSVARKLASTFGRSTNSTVRHATLTNPAMVTQFATIVNRELQVLTNPLIVTDDLDPQSVQVRASLSDSLNECIPISVPYEYFSGFFTTVVPSSMCNALDLPRTSQPPDEIPGPANDDDEDGEQPSYQRIGYGSIVNDDEMPVFVALPVLCPLPPGVTIPTNHNINEPLDEPVDYPAFNTWLIGQRFYLNHNDGWSVTLGGDLFELDAIDDAPDFENLSLIPVIENLVNLASPGTDTHRSTRAHYEDFKNNAWQVLGARLDAEAPPSLIPEHRDDSPTVRFQSSPPVAPPQSDTVSPSMERLLERLTQPTVSLKDQELNDLCGDNLARYQIMFGHRTVPTDDVPSKFVPTTFTPNGNNLLGKPRGEAAAIRLFQSAITSTMEEAGSSPQYVDMRATFDPVQANAAFIGCLRGFQFATNDLPKTLQNNLSILAFLSPVTTSMAYQTLMDENNVPFQAYTMDAAMHRGNPPSTSSKLNTTGKVSTLLDDVIPAFCNFCCIFLKLIANYGKSLLAHHLSEFCSILFSIEGRRWLNKFSTNREAMVNLLMQGNCIVAVHARTANTLEYVDALRSEQTLSPHIYDLAVTCSTGIIAHLQAAVTRGELLEYRH